MYSHSPSWRAFHSSRNFQTVEYQAGIQNWDIVQDKRGMLYIANNFGLLEYDGHRWQTYGVNKGTKVRSVAIDKRGRIYVRMPGRFWLFFSECSRPVSVHFAGGQS